MRNASLARLSTLGLCALVATDALAQARPPRLFKDARQILAFAQAQGRTDVMLLVAAVQGRTAAVARTAESMGGAVRYREDEIGYLRVRIPIARATEFSEIDGIESVTVDMDDSYPYRLTPDGRLKTALGADTTRWPPKWSDYPLRRPYSPLADIDAAQFRKQHPTWDGRGVTIALLDGNLDLLLPEFQTGYTLDGKRVPKIADYLNVTDPRDDAALMPQWVDMRETVSSSGGSLTWNGTSYTAPHDGSFRIGVFSERRFDRVDNAAYMDQDVDRNGNPRGDDGAFAVLWDEGSNDVWVDTDRDRSFADEKALTDYRKRPEIGVFGKDNPATIMRESIGFAVQTDRANKFVSINVGIYQHATEIMGSVVGNKYPRGRLEGVAPGARVVSMFWSGIAHAMLEGLIAAYKHPDVDLIVLEQSVAVASIPYLLADGHHPISVIIQRLATKYDKLVFVPGDNAPAFGFVAEDGLAPLAMSIGGYQSQESYRLNAGFIPEGKDHLHWGALSHGPSGTGQLKPDLLAPSGQMSTDIGYLYRKFEQTLRGLYQLPSGYAVDGGTSTATPMAAGATALVLSAAKQTGIAWDATKLKRALTGSTRFMSALAAHEQGNGLIQVAAAYRLLRTLTTAPPVSITSRASIKTALAGLLQTPGEGVGIYEREGWAAGDHGTRSIVLRRTSGSPAPMTFRATWLGNDGTFSSAPSVTLPLDQDVSFAVQIAPARTGAHTALLSLDHDAVPGHAYRMLNSVVAALRPDASNGFSVSNTATLPRPGDVPTFVLVPAGVDALVFNATVSDTSARLVTISPSREYRYGCGFTNPPAVPCTIPNPEPGVWEINTSVSFGLREYDPDRPSPLKPATATVSARLVGVSLTVDGSVARAGMASSTIDLPVSVTNRMAAGSFQPGQTELSSTRRFERTIRQGEQQQHVVMVPEGATSLRAVVTGAAGSDLDVYLLDCTGDARPAMPPPAEKDSGNKGPERPPANCSMRAKSETLEQGGSVEVSNPAPGRWVVVVDAFTTPPGGASYTYLDAFTDPRLGTLSVADLPARRDSGARWTSTVHIWAAGTTEGGRQLEARIGVVDRELKHADGSRVVLGSISVPVEAVSRR